VPVCQRLAEDRSQLLVFMVWMVDTAARWNLGSSLIQYLCDENVSRIAQQSTTKENNAGVLLETKYQISLVGFEDQKRKHNNGPKENKEGTSLPLKGGTREKSGC
jgi:hypothetical protein